MRRWFTIRNHQLSRRQHGQDTIWSVVENDRLLTSIAVDVSPEDTLWNGVVKQNVIGVVETVKSRNGTNCMNEWTIVSSRSHLCLHRTNCIAGNLVTDSDTITGRDAVCDARNTSRRGQPAFGICGKYPFWLYFS